MNHDPKTTHVAILGAKKGGAHLLRVMKELNIVPFGIYDQLANAPALVTARKEGVLTYAGSFAALEELLRHAVVRAPEPVYILLPSRDPKFRSFCQRKFSGIPEPNRRHMHLLTMDRHFRDYEAPETFRRLFGIEEPESIPETSSATWMHQVESMFKRRYAKKDGH